MNVTLEKTADLEGVVTVELTPEDYAAEVKKQLKEFGRTHQIPGFRKGQMSADMLRRRFGKQVKSDVINDKVYHAVIEFIEKEKIEALGRPLPVELIEIGLEDVDYTLKYEIGWAPEFEIKLDKSVEMNFYTVEVTEQMLKEQDEYFVRRFGKQGPGEEVDATAVVKGPIMELAEDGAVRSDDEAVQNINGILGVFRMKEEVQKLFLGKKVDDKVKFTPNEVANGDLTEVASLLNIDAEKAAAVADKPFEMTITEIITLTPAEHNQEFYDTAFGKDNVKDEEQYKQALANVVKRQYQPVSQNIFRLETEEYMVDKCKDMPLPADFIKKYVMAEENLDVVEVDKAMPDVLEQFRWHLSEEKVRRTLDVKVTEEDLLALAKQRTIQQFAQYGMQGLDDQMIEQFARHILEDKEQRKQLARMANEGALFGAIFNAVTIKEVALPEKELMAKLEAYRQKYNPDTVEEKEADKAVEESID